jgi:hypothetical protein
MTSSSNNQTPLPSAPPALIVTAESVTVAQQSPSPVMATAQIMNQQQNDDIQITVAASVPATTGAGQTTQNNTHEPPVQKFILTAKSGKNGSHEGQAAHGGHGRYNGPRGIGHRGKHGQNGMNAQPPLPGGNSGTIDISVSMENICNNGKVDVKGALKGDQDSYPTTNTYFVPVTTDFIVEAKGGAGGDGGFGGIGGNGGHGRSGRVRNSYGYSFHYTLLIFILS